MSCFIAIKHLYCFSSTQFLTGRKFAERSAILSEINPGARSCHYEFVRTGLEYGPMGVLFTFYTMYVEGISSKFK